MTFALLVAHDGHEQRFALYEAVLEELRSSPDGGPSAPRP
jgi:hypothetical protein